MKRWKGNSMKDKRHYEELIQIVNDGVVEFRNKPAELKEEGGLKDCGVLMRKSNHYKVTHIEHYQCTYCGSVEMHGDHVHCPGCGKEICWVV